MLNASSSYRSSTIGNKSTKIINEENTKQEVSAGPITRNSYNNVSPYVRSQSTTNEFFKGSEQSDSNQELNHNDVNNIVSHDSPSNDIYSNDVSLTDNVSIKFSSSDSHVYDRKSSLQSNSVSDSASSTNSAISHDLPYNEVLPREQYDRELQERKEKEQSEHHDKLQQLLDEKRKKLKEKKRKHRNRKVSLCCIYYSHIRAFLLTISVNAFYN